MAPTTGWVGSSAVLTVTSTSFPLEGDYIIMWSSVSRNEPGKTTVIKEGNAPRGSFAITETFTIPESPMGLYFVLFVRPGREETNQTFSYSVLPRIKVQPAQVSPGIPVTIYGTGLPVDDTDVVSFDGKPLNLNIRSNQSGSFTVDYTIPAATAGEHQFSVSSTKVSAGIPSTTVAVVPSIALDTQQPQAGSTVVMTGKGFGSRLTVSVKCNGVAVTNSPSTNDYGDFSYTFSVPSGQGGYSFVATDQSGNSASINAGTVSPPPPPAQPPPPQPAPPPQPKTTQPPPAAKAVAKPTIVTPKGESFGFIGSEIVKFAWSDGSGLNSGNITYTLEIADNFKFSGVKPSMRAAGLTKTSHAMIVEPGTYFWRVKAVDSTGTESEWANSLYAFNVGMLPDWAIIGGIVLAIIVAYLIFKPAPRRQSQNNSPYYYY